MCPAECIVIIASCVKLINILSDNAESSNGDESLCHLLAHSGHTRQSLLQAVSK